MSRTLGTVDRAFPLLSALTATVLLSGCGAQYATAPVSGRLTMDGQPVAGARVLFSPIDDPNRTGRPAGEPGQASSGTAAEDGSFTLSQFNGESGAVIGPHKVMFEPPPTKRPTIPGEERELMTPEEIKELEAHYAAMPIYPPLPPGLKISPPEVEVKSGDNTFDFALEKSP